MEPPNNQPGLGQNDDDTILPISSSSQGTQMTAPILSNPLGIDRHRIHGTILIPDTGDRRHSTLTRTTTLTKTVTSKPRNTTISTISQVDFTTVQPAISTISLASSLPLALNTTPPQTISLGPTTTTTIPTTLESITISFQSSLTMPIGSQTPSVISSVSRTSGLPEAEANQPTATAASTAPNVTVVLPGFDTSGLVIVGAILVILIGIALILATYLLIKKKRTSLFTTKTGPEAAGGPPGFTGHPTSEGGQAMTKAHGKVAGWVHGAMGGQLGRQRTVESEIDEMLKPRTYQQPEQQPRGQKGRNLPTLNAASNATTPITTPSTANGDHVGENGMRIVQGRYMRPERNSVRDLYLQPVASRGSPGQFDFDSPSKQWTDGKPDPWAHIQGVSYFDHD